MEPEDACGGGCVTLGSGTALLRGGRIRAGGTLSGEALSLFASKSGGKKTQPKQPAVELLPSLHFKRRGGHPAKHSHVEHGHACRRFCAESLPPDFLTSSFNPEQGGNFCHFFQLCTGLRCPGTTLVIESRWPFAANAKLCTENLCKSVQWIIDLCE